MEPSMNTVTITVPVAIEISDRELRRLRRGLSIELGTADLGTFHLTSYDGEPITPKPKKPRKAKVTAAQILKQAEEYERKVPKVKPLKNGTRTERL